MATNRVSRLKESKNVNIAHAKSIVVLLILSSRKFRLEDRK